MIRNWQVGNFKSIRDDTELALAPLTLFAGENSSGKSSFIQSILLVAQSLTELKGDQTIELNGKFAELGRFDDIKSDGSAEDRISVRFRCSPLAERDRKLERNEKPSAGDSTLAPDFSQIQEVDCELTFGVNDNDWDVGVQQCHPKLFSSELSCLGRNLKKTDQESRRSVRISARSIFQYEDIILDCCADDLHSGLVYDVRLDDSSLAETKGEFDSAKPVGCKMSGFLPEKILMTLDSVDEHAETVADLLQSCPPSGRDGNHKWNCEDVLQKDILEILLGVLNDPEFKNPVRESPEIPHSGSAPPEIASWREIIRSMPESKRMDIVNCISERKKNHDKAESCLQEAMKGFPVVFGANPPELIAESVKYLENFLTRSIWHLGNMNMGANAVHSLETEANQGDIEIQGWQTASVFKQHEHDMIQCIPAECFTNPIVEPEIVSKPLGTAVSDWMLYLGLANSVECVPIDESNHELRVGTSDSMKSHGLAHAGTGINQILSILVFGLLANRGATLIIEHPELRMHPRIQSLMGDFFLSLMLCDKQCIVETHSVHLFDRLRYRIASAPPDNELVDLLKVYFVEKPSEGSSFKEVKINRFGAVTDWPKGFFEESVELAESILLAAFEKKRMVGERQLQ